MTKSLLLVSVLMVGCAQVKVEAPKTVQFPYAPELLEKIQKESVHRGPASVEESEKSEKSEKSNRRVYFTSLYHQFLTLGDYLGKDRSIESCPAFHHDKVETDAVSVPKVSFYKQGSVEEEGKDFFPELAFTKTFSLRDYHAEMKREIDDLCETGISDNFYKFDNLVTHYADNKAFHSNKKAMASVLKIPVFANFYLVKMVMGERGNLSTHPEEQRFIQLSHTEWFQDYVAEAGLLRKSFVKTKLVRR